MSTLLPEIEERRARRAFSAKPVSKETLTRIFEAAVKAPSCNNRQPWRFLVATEGEALAKAREAVGKGNYWALEAPVLVTVLTRDDLDCQLNDDRNYAQFDTGMAVMNMLLQATREGLYTHPMAGFDPMALRSSFAIEEGTRVITMIAVGYPGDGKNLNEKHSQGETAGQERSALSEAVKWNDWTPLV